MAGVTLRPPKTLVVRQCRRSRDPAGGQTCHQCRQVKEDFGARCTNMTKYGLCTKKLCHRCLWNRYRETAEQVAALGNWTCPVCRGICNCSEHRRKKGLAPTGKFSKRAKKPEQTKRGRLGKTSSAEIGEENLVEIAVQYDWEELKRLMRDGPNDNGHKKNLTLAGSSGEIGVDDYALYDMDLAKHSEKK